MRALLVAGRTSSISYRRFRRWFLRDPFQLSIRQTSSSARVFWILSRSGEEDRYFVDTEPNLSLVVPPVNYSGAGRWISVGWQTG